MEKQALTGMLRHVLKIMALRVHEYVLGINESHFSGFNMLVSAIHVDFMY